MKKNALLILIVSSSFTFAQNIFQDSFASYNSNIKLSGQGSWTNNSSLTGGLGTCVGAICENAKVITQNISTTGYGTSTKAFSLTPDTDGCGTAFTPFTTNGDLYFGMVINISNASSSPSDFFRVMSGANLTTTFRMLVQPTSSTTYSIGIRKGDTANATVYSSNSYNYGTDNLIIIKYTQAAGINDDTVTLYANANYGAGETGNTASAINFAGLDQSGNIDRMCFRQNIVTGIPTGRVGLISVSTTWAGLSFNLSTNEFNKNFFVISYSETNKGVLNIKSDIKLDKALLNIYDIEGRKIDSQTISLEKDINDAVINPIQNSGTYIVEIEFNNDQRFTQKIVVK